MTWWQYTRKDGMTPLSEEAMAPWQEARDVEAWLETCGFNTARLTEYGNTDFMAGAWKVYRARTVDYSWQFAVVVNAPHDRWEVVFLGDFAAWMDFQSTYGQSVLAETLTIIQQQIEHYIGKDMSTCK